MEILVLTQFGIKAPVTPMRVFSALAQSCLIFRSTVRSQKKNTLVFFVKNGLSPRLYNDQGVATEIAWRSIAFLRCSCWWFSAQSLSFHCVFMALTMHALHFHGVHTALRAWWWRSDIPQNAIQCLCKCHGQPQCLHNDCAAMVPTALLLECRAKAFVLSMLKVCALIRHSMRSLSIYCRLRAKKGPAPPPLGNFADISYLEENVKPHLLRDVCTLCSGALVSDSLLHMLL